MEKSECCPLYSEREFLLRRLHSLTGIVPIGVFMLFHFFENAAARRGPEAFNAAVIKISEMPYLYLLEIFGLIVPILFHGIYGLFITSSSKPNLGYANSRNIAYVLQRVTGILAFFYIGYHVYTTRVWALLEKGDHITFQDMATKLSDPLALGIYIVGITAATFHLCNGVWSFSITWGLVVSEKAQQRLAQLCFLAFIVLCTIGLDILSAFVRDESLLASLGNFLF